MTRPSRRSWLAALALGGIFAVALLAPIPATPNVARDRVVAQVGERFPGWRIDRVRSSWEGAWTVVITCGDREVGFQLIPGHGLPAGAAWLHPDDRFSHDRLAAISDDRTYLVWYRVSGRIPSLSCRAELARPRAGSSGTGAD